VALHRLLPAKEGVEGVEALFPEDPVVLEPSGGALQRGGLEEAVVLTPPHLSPDEPGPLERLDGFDSALKDMSKGPARSEMVASEARSRARMRRRVGSPRAAKARSRTASG